MPVLIRKGRRADPQKDQAILEAARRLFLERGYGASIDDIAATAGVSKQTIYARYACKHDLLSTIVHQMAEDIVSLLDDSVRSAGTEETLIRFGERFVEIVFNDDRIAMQRLIIAQAAQFPELAHAYYASGPAYVRKRLAAFLARESEAGRLVVDDADEASSQLLGLILGSDHIASLIGVLDPETKSLQRARVRRAVAAFVKLASG